MERGVPPPSLSQSVPDSERLCERRPFKSGGAKVKQDIFQVADWPGNFYGEAKCVACGRALLFSPFHVSRENVESRMEPFMLLHKKSAVEVKL